MKESAEKFSDVKTEEGSQNIEDKIESEDLNGQLNASNEEVCSALHFSTE